MTTIENGIWYGFMIPFFIIGGGIIVLGSLTIMPHPIYFIAGTISIGLGFFLIWLDKHYDLSEYKEVEYK